MRQESIALVEKQCRVVLKSVLPFYIYNASHPGDDKKSFSRTLRLTFHEHVKPEACAYLWCARSY